MSLEKKHIHTPHIYDIIARKGSSARERGRVSECVCDIFMIMLINGQTKCGQRGCLTINSVICVCVSFLFFFFIYSLVPSSSSSCVLFLVFRQLPLDIFLTQRLSTVYVNNMTKETEFSTPFLPPVIGIRTFIHSCPSLLHIIHERTTQTHTCTQKRPIISSLCLCKRENYFIWNNVECVCVCVCVVVMSRK